MVGNPQVEPLDGELLEVGVLGLVEVGVEREGGQKFEAEVGEVRGCGGGRGEVDLGGTRVGRGERVLGREQKGGQLLSLLAISVARVSVLTGLSMRWYCLFRVNRYTAFATDPITSRIEIINSCEGQVNPPSVTFQRAYHPTCSLLDYCLADLPDSPPTHARPCQHPRLPCAMPSTSHPRLLRSRTCPWPACRMRRSRVGLGVRLRRLGGG